MKLLSFGRTTQTLPLEVLLDHGFKLFPYNLYFLFALFLHRRIPERPGSQCTKDIALSPTSLSREHLRLRGRLAVFPGLTRTCGQDLEHISLLVQLAKPVCRPRQRINRTLMPFSFRSAMMK